MNKPALRDESQKHEQPTSDVREVGRFVDPFDTGFDSDYPELDFTLAKEIPTLSTRGFPATCEVLAQMALDHLAGGEVVIARREAEDAWVMIEALAGGREQRDRASAASAALMAGDALLALGDPDRARACFESAMDFFDSQDDRVRGGDARFGLGKALLTLGDSRARTVLEDAGELFEAANRAASIQETSVLLRRAELELEAPPLSRAGTLDRDVRDGWGS